MYIMSASKSIFYILVFVVVGGFVIYYIKAQLVCLHVEYVYSVHNNYPALLKQFCSL